MNFPAELYEIVSDHLIRFVLFILLCVMIAMIYFLVNRRHGIWFLLMTTVWIVTNSLIATLLARHIQMRTAGRMPFLFGHVEKWLDINLGFDVAFGMAAFLLLFLSRRSIRFKTLLNNFGKAVLLQSAGLFLLNLIFLQKVVALSRLYFHGI